MEPLIRRMALIASLGLAFAIVFTAIVESKQNRALRFHPGTTVQCLHPASPFCIPGG